MRAIAYYANTNEINSLILYSDLRDIYKDIRSYLTNKKIQINEISILSDSESENFKCEKKLTII